MSEGLENLRRRGMESRNEVLGREQWVSEGQIYQNRRKQIWRNVTGLGIPELFNNEEQVIRQGENRPLENRRETERRAEQNEQTICFASKETTSLISRVTN